jgi:hypothetical protein
MATKSEREVLDLVVTVQRMACRNLRAQAEAVPQPYRRRIQSQVDAILEKVARIEAILEAHDD